MASSIAYLQISDFITVKSDQLSSEELEKLYKQIKTCLQKKKEEQWRKREKEIEAENEKMLKEWFSRALIELNHLIKFKYLVEENGQIHDDLYLQALYNTEEKSNLNYWYVQEVEMEFGDQVPCDADDCWYLGNSGFDGKLYCLRFIDDVKLCDVCYENYENGRYESRIEIDDFLDRFKVFYQDSHTRKV